MEQFLFDSEFDQSHKAAARIFEVQTQQPDTYQNQE